MSNSTGTGRDRLDARWDEELASLGEEDDEGHQDATDAAQARRAERQRRADQHESAAERGEDGDEQHADATEDAAEVDDQLIRAEGEGMVTEHAKVSATDPGPEPLPEPEPAEPEPDHGPDDPAWEQRETHH